MKKSGFDSFGLSPETLKSIKAMGYLEPTEVQTEAIPLALEGKDLVVQSRTGTGKTAAFGIPLVERVDPELLAPQALVLCPTRELAVQVHAELAGLSKGLRLQTFPIYGGASMRQQIDAINAGLQVIAGTPGRVLDHIRSRRLFLDDVHMLVLDEADELLSMGFYEEVSRILERVPPKRQTLLFSATLSPGVEGLIYRHQQKPIRLALSSDNILVEEVHHAFYVTRAMDKRANLARVLLHEEPKSAIIFVNTRHEARTVTSFLKHEGFQAEMLSGEMSQRDRERVMNSIKRNELRFMVATDVAARGIDIEDLSHVINYSPPENRDVYVHRTGRTGRIGKSGIAITLVSLRDLPRWGDFEAIDGVTMEERQLPTNDQLLEKKVDRVIHAVRRLEAQVPAGRDEPVPARYRVAAERLLEQGLEPSLLARLLHDTLTPAEPPVEPARRGRDEPSDDGLDDRPPLESRRPPKRRPRRRTR